MMSVPIRLFRPRRHRTVGDYLARRPGRIVPVRRVHGIGCLCCQLSPGPAESVHLSAQQIGAWSLAGFATGLVLATGIDWLAAGPGPLAMFGAWS